jgi:hypothetical protein
MPTALLTPIECLESRLPRVCAKCGAPADAGVRLTFQTPLIHFLLGLFLATCPPLLLGLAIVQNIRHGFEVPMCEPHRADWRWRDRLTLVTYIPLAVVYMAALAWAAFPWPDDPFDEFAAIGVVVYGLCWYVWIVFATLLWTRTVRISWVTRWGVRLSGVHEAFVTALRDDRARDANPARLPFHGDIRDDYDDRPD